MATRTLRPQFVPKSTDTASVRRAFEQQAKAAREAEKAYQAAVQTWRDAIRNRADMLHQANATVAKAREAVNVARQHARSVGASVR
jgi:uncharacterized protein YukE